MAVTIDGSTGVTTNAGGLVNPSTTIDGINYSCRAWVNFNGSGTVAIRASGNVTSITDYAVGEFGVNFTNAMPDANYSVCATSGKATDGDAQTAIEGSRAFSTTVVGIETRNAAGAMQDPQYICVSIFR